MVSEKGRNTSRYGSASRRAVASGSRPSSSGEQGQSRDSSRVASSGGGVRPSVFQRAQAAAAVSGYESKTASAFNRDRVVASRTARDEALRSFELLSIRKWSFQWALLCKLDSSLHMVFDPLFPRNSQFFMYYHLLWILYQFLHSFYCNHDNLLILIMRIMFVSSFFLLQEI